MAELLVNKKAVFELLKNSDKQTFVIPEYQRAYAWDKELCETLWEDLTSFYEEQDDKEEYYLGTVVICKNEDGDIEIVDGQQRITSLMLLMRAFYSILEDAAKKGEAVKEGLKRNIEPCLWKQDFATADLDRGKPNIVSRIATASDNEAFHELIRSGEPQGGETNYEINYKFFLEKCNEYNPSDWAGFVTFVLTRCVLFPIEADKLDTALDIFNTLNDRGLPLTDSDIFKSYMLKNARKDGKEKEKAFIQQWKDLEEDSKESGKSGFEMTDLFRYYSHYLRGGAGNLEKEKALRTFYKEDKWQHFDDYNKVMGHLTDLSEFWRSVGGQTKVVYLSDDSRKYLHCLMLYPNEYWRYVVSVFYLAKNEAGEVSAQELEHFLAKLAAFLYAKFILQPTVNAIKSDVFHICAQLRGQKTEDGDRLDKAKLDAEQVMHQMQNTVPPKIKKGLSLLHAYQHQSTPIEKKFHLEHILPQKWKDANYHGWSEDDAAKYMDSIGNLIPLEKKTNIQAGNSFFAEKRKRYYGESRITIVKELAAREQDDWLPEDIEKRESEVIDKIMAFFQSQKVVQ